MKPWKTLERAEAPGGGELVLQERDGQYVVRVDGKELMSSRTHGSEERMARLAREHGPKAKTPRVLVGGLGLGYTLRATLECFPASAEVMVAEMSPAVVAWNRTHLAPLAQAPLEDPRVKVFEGDVLAAARSSPPFEAILLDVDNGPVALTLERNSSLYSERGIAAFRNALTPRGVLVVWSAGPDDRYLAKLRRGGFSAEMKQHTEQGRRHTLFVATRQG